MLEPPWPIWNPPAERPGGAVGAGESVWVANDVPMYLHVFADIVQHVLCSWWGSLGDHPFIPASAP
jgi:hypothetical protein